jgi:hypothetical protein
MSPPIPAEFDVKNVELIYKAEFGPPIFEIVLPEKQAAFLKLICNEFGFKFGDIIFNNQLISSGIISFRKPLTSAFSFFDCSIGVDELQTVCVNPQTDIESWMLTIKVLDNLVNLAKVQFKKQTLIVKLQCLSEKFKYSNFIDNIFNYENKKNFILSKGASFSIKSPWPECQLGVIFEKSMLIEDGMFLLIQAFYNESMQEYKDILKTIISYFTANIEPLFNIKINYKGRE